MTQFTLRFLGQFQITADAQPITEFHSDKARALLAYLALEPREHARTELATLLWPEIGDQYANTNLRNTIYRLRQTLDGAVPGGGDQLLTVTRRSARFNSENADVDASRFQRLLDETQGGTVYDLDPLEEAVGLYRGELLLGFGVADAPAFEEWLLLHRELLHQQAIFAFHRLTTSLEAAGHYERAYSVAGRLLTLDRYREESYRQRMRLQAHLGHPEQSLQQLEQLRRLLHEEMGVAPSAETMTLAHQIAGGEFVKAIGRQDDKGKGRQDDRRTRRQDDKPIVPPSGQPFDVAQNSPVIPSSSHPVIPTRTLDLSDIPDPGSFFGRAQERLQLEQWLCKEHTRVVAILGLGGMGKTVLAAQTLRAIAAKESRGPIDAIYWRSLVNAPPLTDLLSPLLQILSDQQLTELPANTDEQLRLLLGYLREQRVLLVLDNLESILSPEEAGAYRPGYEAYGQLIQQMATLEHQSHLLLTSRERPHDYGRLARDGYPIQSLQLTGLDDEAGRQLLMQRGVLGDGDREAMLVQRYSGNPLALKLVADTVDAIFGGDIDGFLDEETLVFDDIRTILDQQFVRLSVLEQELLFWLAVEREPTAIAQLRQNLLHGSVQRLVVEALRGLQRRALVERVEAGFMLQNVIVEYLSERLIETIGHELESGELALVHRIALLKAQSKAYVRQSQARMILMPLGQRLLNRLGPRFKVQMQQILTNLRHAESPLPSYAAGNILNLMLQLKIDLTGADFSRLNLWQLFLQGLSLHGADLTAADLSGARFSDIFDAVCTVAYSPNGELVAIGTLSGEIRIWQSSDHLLVAILQGHADSVWSVTFSPDNQLLASGSGDRTVRVWDVSTGQARHILRGHEKSIGAVAFSPDGLTVASGSGDRSVRVWDLQSGTMRHLLDQTGWVVTLVFCPQSTGAAYLLASGGEDRVIHLWEIPAPSAAPKVYQAEATSGGATSGGAAPGTTRLIRTLQGHTDWVRSVAFSSEGSKLVSGSYDQTVRLWDVATGQTVQTLTGHTNSVLTVAFAPNGELVASAGRDRTVRLWRVASGQIFRTLLGHTDWVRAVAFSPDGAKLASGGYDQRLSFWSVAAGQLEYMIQGYSDPVWSIDFSPDGQMLVSSSGEDVRLWAVASGRLQQSLHGHTSRVRSVTVAPQRENASPLLASGGYDNTIRLWALPTDMSSDSSAFQARRAGPLPLVLTGHTDAIQSIAFSPDGRLMASGSDDSTVRLWDLSTGLTTQVAGSILYTGRDVRTARIASVTFNGGYHGQRSPLLLASASGDQTICLWEVAPTQAASLANTGSESAPHVASATFAGSAVRLRAILHEPVAGNRLIAFRPYREGIRPLLASGGYDGAIRLWDLTAISSATAIQDLTDQIHLWRLLQTDTGRIRCLAFSPDGQSLVSGGTDRNLSVWDIASGEVRHTLVGHQDRVLSVVFQPQADPTRPILASSSADATIKLWDLASGACLQTLRPPGPYAGMNITGVTGISAAQRAALKVLGAVET